MNVVGQVRLQIQVNAIHQAQVTVAAIELYAPGMQQTLHVQLWHTMAQKQEIGDYPQKMNLKHGELKCHLLIKIKVTMA